MPTFDILNTPPTETIRLIANYLNRITAANDRLPTCAGLTRFHARTIPTIDIQGYLNRILKYAPCGNECFLAVLIYLDRMSRPRPVASSSSSASSRRGDGDMHPPVVINSYNVHRLLIAGVMVAVKFLSDIFFTNVHISRVGGLPVQELNALEIEFLLLHEFNLNVSVEEIQQCGDMLLNQGQSIQSVNDALRDRLHVSPPDGREDGRSRSSSISVGNPPAASPERAPSPSVRRFRASSDVSGLTGPGSIGASALMNGGMPSFRQRDYYAERGQEDREQGSYGYDATYPASYQSHSGLNTPQSMVGQSPSPSSEPHGSYDASSPHSSGTATMPVAVNPFKSAPSAPVLIKPTPRWHSQPIGFGNDGGLMRYQQSVHLPQQQHQQQPIQSQSHHQGYHPYFSYPRSASATCQIPVAAPAADPVLHPQRHSYQPMFRQQHTSFTVTPPEHVPQQQQQQPLESRRPSPPSTHQQQLQVPLTSSVLLHRRESFPLASYNRARSQSHSIPRPDFDPQFASPQQHLTPQQHQQQKQQQQQQQPQQQQPSQQRQGLRIHQHLRLHRPSVPERPTAPEFRYSSVFEHGGWANNGGALDAYARGSSGGLVTCREA
ncbi:hypothetical protein HK104_003286 [Borealophlyctis nickersoniae]|nr:hypothetical protein HK104_003286 [Borealophlyctis nickersoniae]